MTTTTDLYTVTTASKQTHMWHVALVDNLGLANLGAGYDSDWGGDDLIIAMLVMLAMMIAMTITLMITMVVTMAILSLPAT